jgi:hypothetical protein
MIGKNKEQMHQAMPQIASGLNYLEATASAHKCELPWSMWFAGAALFLWITARLETWATLANQHITASVQSLLRTILKVL